MIFGMLEDMNFFNIITRVISDDFARINFFKNMETESLRAIEPTLLNIVKHLFGLYAGATSFDSKIILSTTWLQMIIPLFSVPVCVSFYQMYHTIDHFFF